jgi:predicted nucleic-acid-binding Zn-ribbon protein
VKSSRKQSFRKRNKQNYSGKIIGTVLLLLPILPLWGEIMALFDNNEEFRCNKCGCNTFTEKTIYHYSKTKGRIKDIIEQTSAGNYLECTNPECRNLIDKNKESYFKNSEVILR